MKLKHNTVLIIKFLKKNCSNHNIRAKQNFILVLILWLYPIVSFGQSDIDYIIIEYNPTQTIKNSTRIYQTTKNPKEKSLELYKIACAYEAMNDKLNMRLFLEKAEKQLSAVTDHEFKSVMLSRIASNVSGELYYFKAISLINKALKESDAIKNNDSHNYTKAFAYNYLGLIEHNSKNYYKTIQLLPIFLKHFNKQSEQAKKKNKKLLLLGYINFGDAYMQNGDFVQAEKMFLNGKSILDGRYKDLEACIYTNLIDLNLKKGLYDKSIYYSDILLRKLPKEGFLDKKEYTYRILAECYKHNQNVKKNQFFLAKQDSIINILAKRENEIIKANNDIEKKIEENAKGQTWDYKLVVFTIIISGITYFYIRKRQTKIKQRLLRSKKILEKDKIKDQENKNVKVPLNIELDLLKKLERFEKSNKYTNSKMSVAILAGQFETNVQYLSEIINKNKGKNFNSYINELRINYIIDHLRNDKKLRTYKISYLASYAGFISHSTFSKAFKLQIGILPSEYIKQLQEEL
ncbi:helix-turn-helix domain-containing protein [Flavobacterium sp. 245]|uniref:helix-turn-helix domain-containing protein n=1 Tax=Flavobacterium sp. 245 TaxID=2512115 RepID=UPI00105EE5FC|nr:AraC family transcriptional regulator [Flavobacterium sp. 245]TDO96142.1 helix-turn-helix protein [Flavobacterium sp. 245]